MLGTDLFTPPEFTFKIENFLLYTISIVHNTYTHIHKIQNYFRLTHHQYFKTVFDIKSKIFCPYHYLCTTPVRTVPMYGAQFNHNHFIIQIYSCTIRTFIVLYIYIFFSLHNISLYTTFICILHTMPHTIFPMLF